MEKTIKLWQAVVGTIMLIFTVGGAIMNMSNKIETQRLRIEYLESISRDHGLQIMDMIQSTNQQFKEINSKLTDILISMQNKEDRVNTK
jgi:predicted site-specific integrase-resolvase